MDIRLSWNEEGTADMALEGGDLATDLGVTTGVIVSLFSDARAPEEVILAPGADRRGWWGELADQFGSLLWVLQRSKRVEETLELARETVARALAWMTRDGVAETIEVVPRWETGGLLLIRVNITRGTARRWADKWDTMNPATYSAQGVKLELIWR